MVFAELPGDIPGNEKSAEARLKHYIKDLKKEGWNGEDLPPGL